MVGGWRLVAQQKPLHLAATFHNTVHSTFQFERENVKWEVLKLEAELWILFLRQLSLYAKYECL